MKIWKSFLAVLDRWCDALYKEPVVVSPGRHFVTPVTLSVTMPILKEPRVVPIRHRRADLTCVSVSGSKKKVRFVTRRGHQMVAEIVDRNGGGEVFLRRPGHRFGPIFRRVLAE